ncbi:MAG: hypothetical protein JRH07_17630 [Deltaproteobacteria bacterium]|nr:hypothetical protein [Deltaproteobacteria bacterium]
MRRRDVLVVFFVLVKVLVVLVLWASLDIPTPTAPPNPAYAKEGEQQGGEESVGSPEHEVPPGPGDSKDLLVSIKKEREALRRREEALAKREERVRQEEARLRKVEQEIEKKLETLTQIRLSLQELIQEKKGLDDDILKKLAKVYESTPPEQAGPMLSRLDVRLAAQILIRMDGRKAGKIWGFVSPERASQISSEITHLK